MKKLFFMITVFVLTNLACSIYSIPEWLGLGCGTKPFPEGVLFQDEFSSKKGCWDTANSDSGSTAYLDGQYQIAVNSTQFDVWGNPGLSFAEDISIEVDATKTSGPDSGDYGIICRYQDEQNFYQFMVTADGFYGILMVVNGSQQIISSEDLLETETVIQGNASNHLRADCIGETLSFYVNGKLVATVNDSTFTKGDVGLFAGTFDDAGVVAVFDNFKVLKP
jgi:hypothetical protein